MRKLPSAGIVLAALALSPGLALADVAVGTRISNVTLRDARDKPAAIPDLGKKVLTIFYADPDVKGQNERFGELLERANFDRAQHRRVGVVNMKDTWKPSFLIRKMIRSKVKTFKSTVLMDPAHQLKQAWKLGKTNGAVVVLVIGSDRKVKFVKRGAMSSSERTSTLELIKTLLANGGK